MIDNVYMRNGALFVVTDSPASFPAPDAILADADAAAPVAREIRFVTRRQAVEMIGYSAHRCVVVTLLSIFIDMN